MRDSIAVTGATGYVGRNVRLALARMHIPAVCIARRRFATRVSETALISESWTSQLARRKLQRCSAMIHLAGVGRHVGGAGYGQNVELARQAVEACVHSRIPRIVFVSGLGADTGYTGYFASKLESERVIMASRVQCMIFRSSYIVGRRDLLTSKIRRLARARRPTVPGTGRYIIQPIHVDDACAILISAALSHNSWRKTLDLVGPKKITYRRFVSMIAGVRAARSIPIERAIHNAVRDVRAAYDIDELAILLGSFGGDYDALCRESGMRPRALFGTTRRTTLA